MERLRTTLILNVDDYVPGRYARTKLLRQMNFEVIEAGTGKETLQMVEQFQPLLVLLDVNLPDMTGFEVCRQLRGNPKTADTTIVHISASSIQTQHQVYGLDSGADGYIVEPVEPAVLIATVNAFIRTRRAEDALRKSNDELRWFTYRVGHDLSEPLRTLTVYAELLKERLEGDSHPDTARYLDFIADGAIRMRGFMDALLQYSQASIVQSVPGPVDCEGLLVRVLANLDSSIRDSGARITHEFLPTVCATDQLEDVFQNLISNAIKYARPDVVPEIHVSFEEEAAGWLFSVQDNGIGVEPQFREDIFEAFKRLHGREIPGTGLGLALSRKIVEAHGGALWMQSAQGPGSLFLFRLPHKPAQIK